MRHPGKWVAFIFLVFGSRMKAYAQQPVVPEELTSRFVTRAASQVQEKVFLHSDKTTYLSGETCWFSLYCVNATDHRPLGASRIAYVELLTRNGLPVAQAKVALDSGFGAGSFPISAAIASGHYLLRTYTAWMQNFPADLFFVQDITVINTIHGSASELNDTGRLPSLALFPEGGQLVQGLPARIACRARDGHGLALQTKLELRNKQNLVSAATTDSNGVARFEITPLPTDSLYVNISGDNRFSSSVPAATVAGYTLMLDKTAGKISITIHATASEENKMVFLGTHTREALKDLQSGRISGGEAHFLLSTDVLDDGISVITLLDENRSPVLERLYFKQPERQMKIGAATDLETYFTRSPIQFSINTSADGVPVSARLSASLFRLDSLQKLPVENILTWLLLASDLPGISPGVDRFVTENNEESRLILDNIMLTNGWRRFNWPAKAAAQLPVLHFLPEMEGPIVKARVSNRTTGLPVANIPYILSIPGRKSFISTSTSDIDGELQFVLNSFFTSEQLVLTPVHAADSSYRLDLNHVFSDSPGYVYPAPLRLNDAVTQDLTERHIAVQVENSYAQASQIKRLPDQKVDSSSFYGVPDRHYHLDSYIRYITMEEVLREFVDNLRIRRDGARFNFQVVNGLFNTFFEQGPLILLDGVPVADATKVVAVDPLKIRDIDIVTHRFYKGAQDFEGIVSFTSYTGEIGLANLDPGSVILDYAGLQERREFRTPDYADSTLARSSIPDFRTTIWWAPDLRSGPQGLLTKKGFTGDLTGRYALVVEGVSADGKAGYDVKIITVVAGH